MSRAQIEDAIEALLVLLDEMDGDIDREDGDGADLEPSLGWSTMGSVGLGDFTDDLEVNEVAA